MSERVLLIPAAGVGERMKIGYPKQYYPLIGEQTMLEVFLQIQIRKEL